MPIFQELYPFFREAFEAAPEGIDRIYPEITSKKSLGAFIAKTATRAGIVLWVKPFQNMRSTRATELIEVFPAHIVNAWMGHTEAVAMAHYRQSTGKAAEKYFEQAAGSGEFATEKPVGEMVLVPADVLRQFIEQRTSGRVADQTQPLHQEAEVVE